MSSEIQYPLSKTGGLTHGAMLFRVLEPRIVFDAALPVVVNAVADAAQLGSEAGTGAEADGGSDEAGDLLAADGAPEIDELSEVLWDVSEEGEGGDVADYPGDEVGGPLADAGEGGEAYEGTGDDSDVLVADEGDGDFEGSETGSAIDDAMVLDGHLIEVGDLPSPELEPLTDVNVDGVTGGPELWAGAVAVVETGGGPAPSVLDTALQAVNCIEGECFPPPVLYFDPHLPADYEGGPVNWNTTDVTTTLPGGNGLPGDATATEPPGHLIGPGTQPSPQELPGGEVNAEGVAGGPTEVVPRVTVVDIGGSDTPWRPTDRPTVDGGSWSWRDQAGEPSSEQTSGGLLSDMVMNQRGTPANGGDTPALTGRSIDIVHSAEDGSGADPKSSAAVMDEPSASETAPVIEAALEPSDFAQVARELAALYPVGSSADLVSPLDPYEAPTMFTQQLRAAMPVPRGDFGAVAATL